MANPLIERARVRVPMPPNHGALAQIEDDAAAEQHDDEDEPQSEPSVRLTTQAPVDGERNSQRGHAKAITWVFDPQIPREVRSKTNLFTMVDQTQVAFRNERALETQFVPEYTGFVESLSSRLSTLSTLCELPFNETKGRHMGKKPSCGDKAPEFRLPDDRENLRTLKSYAGHNLVLYFYPKDDTSGCTKEAVDFSALEARIRESRDSDTGRFAGNYHLDIVRPMPDRFRDIGVTLI